MLPAQSVALLNIFSDDMQLYYGIVATADGRLFQFDYDFLHSDEGHGSFSAWRDCTGQVPHPLTADEVQVGFAIAKEHANAP